MRQKNFQISGVPLEEILITPVFNVEEGGVISDKIYFCDSRARLKTWNDELFV